MHENLMVSLRIELVYIIFFFFQAEDGIRDHCVTGVQTCALPIPIMTETRDLFMLCKYEKITGFSHDGGYAEYMISPAEAVAAMPDELPAEEAAPLLCAGITVFNSLRHSGAKPGDLVAVQGVGGLGHLAIQYATRVGFVAVAIGRGQDKRALAS